MTYFIILGISVIYIVAVDDEMRWWVIWDGWMDGCYIKLVDDGDELNMTEYEV